MLLDRTLPSGRRAVQARYDGQSRVVVDRDGEIIVRSKSGLSRPASGQHMLDVLDVIAPFPTEPGMREATV